MKCKIASFAGKNTRECLRQSPENGNKILTHESSLYDILGANVRSIVTLLCVGGRVVSGGQ